MVHFHLGVNGRKLQRVLLYFVGAYAISDQALATYCTHARDSAAHAHKHLNAHLSHLLQPCTAFVQKEPEICGIELSIMIDIDLLKQMPQPLCRIHSAKTLERCLL